MEKKQIILPSLKFENAPEADLNLHVGFEEEKSLLRNDDRDIVLDLSEQFATERANCNRYKLYGKMKMIFRNMYLGVSNYDYLKERLSLYTDGSDGCFAGYLPYDEFAFLRTDLYRETTVPVSVNVMDQFHGFTLITSGTTEHQNITALTAPYHNWNLYLSYVADHDSVYQMAYTPSGTTIPALFFSSGDGIPFRVEETATSYILTSPVKHGISQGEYIIINSRYYYVNSIGNNTYNSENYVINILKTQLSGTTFLKLINGRRCIDINDKENTTSEYYVQHHKILSTINDYIMDKVGFESPIWEDERKLLFENSAGVNDYLVERNRMESVLFDFKEPFVLSGITNNLGYTPTELYVSVIFKNGNGFFNYPPKVAWSFHFHNSWIDEQFEIGSSPESGITATMFSRDSIDFYSGDTIPQGTIIHGAFAEYNPKEMKERIISEAFHKFVSNPNVFYHGQDLDSTYSGASSINPIGLYYQPHYRFKIRELSPYVETSGTNAIIDNLPENARYFPNEKVWRWRDLYDDGYIDPDGYGTDYPYLNDIHYIHKDINFYLRNEQIFTNKNDGLISFNVKGDTSSCIQPIIDGITSVNVVVITGPDTSRRIVSVSVHDVFVTDWNPGPPVIFLSTTGTTTQKSLNTHMDVVLDGMSINEHIEVNGVTFVTTGVNAYIISPLNSSEGIIIDYHKNLP